MEVEEKILVLCTKCDKNKASNKSHSCSFKCEIHEDCESQCTCCEDCTLECAMDI